VGVLPNIGTPLSCRLAADSAHLSQRRLASISGVDQAHLNRVVAGKTQSPILLRSSAQRLASKLNLKDGAEAFIFGLPRYPSGFDQNRDK
jgi:transcriptional regulator with XRE-family HTH domain